jgi:diguanylate cyclase (GGDEF)-like protein
VGGDEFAIAMPQTEPEQALEVVARVRQAIEELNQAGQLPSRLELSFGVAAWVPGMAWQQLFELADRRLYEEKREHRQGRSPYSFGGGSPTG